MSGRRAREIDYEDLRIGRRCFVGLTPPAIMSCRPPTLTWDFLDQLRKLVRGKLLVKGIVTGEDAAVALTNGVVVVLNHGGRAEERA
jgi:4-hydroxymandelate oxidase